LQNCVADGLAKRARTCLTRCRLNGT